MQPIQDRYKRIIDYMRISVTDRCNLRCKYCMPPEGIKPFSHENILRYEEIVRIVTVAAGLGVKKIRITGGEPLIRKKLSLLISSLRTIKGIEDISLTTNGLLLHNHVRDLAAAGLNRVNVSLDTLDAGKYREITRGGDISSVFRGVEEAQRAGLVPVKLNMIPIMGFNDDEIESFAQLTMSTSLHVRFIEFMPICASALWSQEKYISTEEIRRRVMAIAQIHPVKLRRYGPARYYRLENAPGIIGFISPITHHFCDSCNRLRLTSDGKLRPCLFSETEIDLKSPIRSGASDEELERLIRLSVEVKPRGHAINHEKNFARLKPMSRIGG